MSEEARTPAFCLAVLKKPGRRWVPRRANPWRQQFTGVDPREGRLGRTGGCGRGAGSPRAPPGAERGARLLERREPARRHCSSDGPSAADARTVSRTTELPFHVEVSLTRQTPGAENTVSLRSPDQTVASASCSCGEVVRILAGFLLRKGCQNSRTSQKTSGRRRTEAQGGPLTRFPSTTGEEAAGGHKLIHDQDLAWLQQADVVVAEVTQPSLGVGYELGWAVALHKPVLCLFHPKSGRVLSAMTWERPMAPGSRGVTSQRQRRRWWFFPSRWVPLLTQLFDFTPVYEILLNPDLL
ncbi:hypothetical protein CapIbe_019312 [Capra ibex]